MAGHPKMATERVRRAVSNCLARPWGGSRAARPTAYACGYRAYSFEVGRRQCSRASRLSTYRMRSNAVCGLDERRAL
jgi:hypothetical protein